MSITTSAHQTIAIPERGYSYLTQTQLDFVATMNAFENGKISCAAHNYNQAINLYTIALESLQKSIISVTLHHRALAHELRQNYESALMDSQHANPNNDSNRPDAYLVAANVLIVKKRP